MLKTSISSENAIILVFSKTERSKFPYVLLYLEIVRINESNFVNY